MSPILLALIVSVAINLFVFIFAYRLQTDKLTDITYACTFALLALFFWWRGMEKYSLFKVALLTMVVIWAIRLGMYLLRRVMLKGKDHRFDAFRHIFVRYLRFWMLQATSIWVIALPYIVGLSATAEEVSMVEQSPLLYIGITIWAVGFLIETIADAQKFKFRMNKVNDGKFMDKGLFSIVRFPNYTGEIFVWVGVFLTLIPILQGVEWATIISPLWIIFLLTSLSGVPFLERSNDKRYGHLPEFQAYRKNTKKMIPYLY